MICLFDECPYCVRGHHCSIGETDDLPCMMESPDDCPMHDEEEMEAD